jgi:hypothetical protein
MHGLNTLKHINQQAENRELIARARADGYHVVALRDLAGQLVFFGKYETLADANAAADATENHTLVMAPASTAAA